MPYNTTPIDPPKQYTGQASLPLARTKKIIAADPDIHACSNNAAFAITIATEAFIRHLATQTHTVVRAEKKPRRTVQYRDVATAVHKYDNLEFLLDVVPRTITYKQWKDKQERLERREKEGERVREGVVDGGKGKGGQRTLQSMVGMKVRPVSLEEGKGGDEVMGGDEEEDGGVELDSAGVDEEEEEEADAGESSMSARNGAEGIRSGVGTRPEAELPMEED